MNTVHRISRVTGSITLWVLVVVGAISGVSWALSTAGLVQPLIVTSGSMSPAIATGDLLVATRAHPESVEIGQVMTVRSEKTGDLVTHRVVEVTETSEGFAFRMQGDANDAVDAEEYLVAPSGTVLLVRATVPGAGYVAATLGDPIVSIPLVVGLLGLCALTVLPSRNDDEEPDSGDVGEPSAQPSAAEASRARMEMSS